MTVTIGGNQVHVIQKRDLIAMLDWFRDDASIEIAIKWENTEAATLRGELANGVDLAKALLDNLNDDASIEVNTQAFDDLEAWVKRNFDEGDNGEVESITGYINNVEKADTGEIVIHAIGE